MNIFIVLTVIALLSLLLAFFSLVRQNKIEEIKRAKKDLKKRKVIFYSDSSSSS